jgi:hypothetical protein
MAITNTLIAQPAATRIFSASTGTEHAITTIIFCNTNAVNDTYLNVWVVPFGGVPNTAVTQILKSVYIPPTETFVMESEKLILGGGDSIWAQSSPSGTNNMISALVSSVIIS